MYLDAKIGVDPAENEPSKVRGFLVGVGGVVNELSKNCLHPTERFARSQHLGLPVSKENEQAAFSDAAEQCKAMLGKLGGSVQTDLQAPCHSAALGLQRSWTRVCRVPYVIV